MEQTDTPIPIQFSGTPVSESQSDFYLYPVKGKHRARDVQKAKYWLKSSKKDSVRYIVVEWKIRDDEEPLSKIPDMAMISHMRTELGKKEAYIEELEERLTAKQELKPTPDQIKEIYKDKLYVQQKKEITKLHKNANSLRKGNRLLVTRILELNGTLPKGISEHDFDDPQSGEDG